MNRKKIWAVLLSVAIILMNSGFTVKAEEAARKPDVVIRTEAEFIQFAESVNSGHGYSGQLVVLEADIDLDLSKSITIGGYTYETTSLGYTMKKRPFEGTFDGKNHSVTIHQEVSGVWAGVFGYTRLATITNLTVKGTSAAYDYMAGVVAYAEYTTIDHCRNEATVYPLQSTDSTCDVGGICGYAYLSEITNCENTGTIGGTGGVMTSIGGICGKNEASRISGCTNSGQVFSQGEKVGGIVGYLMHDGTVSDGLNTENASVEGNKYVGGIAGHVADGSKVYSSENRGSVLSYAGYAGGIIGYAESGSAYNVMNAGEVTARNADAYFAGGIIGDGSTGEVMRAVNRGKVSGPNYIGGIIGLAGKNYRVTGIVNYGTVENSLKSKSAGQCHGGIAGTAWSQIWLAANYGTVYAYEMGGGLVGSTNLIYPICESFCVCTVYGTSKQCSYGCGTCEIPAQCNVYVNQSDSFHILRTLNGVLTEARKAQGFYWGYDAEGRVVPFLVNGFGSTRFPYSMTSVDEMVMLSDVVGGGWTDFRTLNNELKIRLDADIYDLDRKIRPIGIEDHSGKPDKAFHGEFDGNGHTVCLIMENPGEEYVGLFGAVRNARITNLRVTGHVSGKGMVGGIAGAACDSVFINCENDAYIYSETGPAGGISGKCTGKGLSFINCLNRGSVSGGGALGGICGQAYSGTGAEVRMFEACLSLGKVAPSGDGEKADAVYYTEERVTSRETYYCSKLTGIGTKNAQVVAYIALLFPANVIGELSDAAKELMRGQAPYVPALDGNMVIITVCFQELVNKDRQEADVCFPGVPATTEANGHREYWYSYADGYYYSDLFLERKVAENETKLATWLKNTAKTGGCLKKLTASKLYMINDLYFETQEEAEAYLFEHNADGIYSISLGGDLLTTLPIKISEDGATVTVELNGHKWTYKGKDNTAVFETSAKDVHIVINGDKDTKKESLKRNEILSDGLSEKMPSIEVDPNYSCRFIICNGITLNTDCVRFSGMKTQGYGGMIYSTGSVRINANFTIIENSFASEEGGAIYIKKSDEISEIKLTNSIFRNCVSGVGGGAIYAHISSYKILGDHRSGFVLCHTADYGGGAIGAVDGEDSLIQDVFFHNCFFGVSVSGVGNINEFRKFPVSNMYGGGAICIRSTDNITISGCEFESCLSDGNGGAVYLTLCYGFRLTDSTFIYCESVGNGHDIYCKDTRGQLKNLKLAITNPEIYMETISTDGSLARIGIDQTSLSYSDVTWADLETTVFAVRVGELYFGTPEEAENYLLEHSEDGITYISLASDFVTTAPIKIIGDGARVTVELNGHKWTYKGPDDTAIFETSAKDVEIRIIGADESKKKTLMKNSIQAEGLSKKMPSIEIDPTCSCRFIICDGITLITECVRFSGMKTQGKGGMIYSTGSVRFDANFTIIEDSSASEEGGAIYIRRELDRESNQMSSSLPRSEIHLTNSIFRNCASGMGGGAIYASQTSVSVLGDHKSGFISCHTPEYGGGAIGAFTPLVDEPASSIQDVFFDSCFFGASVSGVGNINEIRENPAWNNVNGGGAICILGLDNITIFGCEFKYCLSDGNGGAVFLNLCDNSLLADSTFNYCETVGNGHDVYCQFSSGEFRNLSITCPNNFMDTVTKDGSPARVAINGENNITWFNIETTNSTVASILSSGNLAIIIVIFVMAAAITVLLLLLVKKNKNK